MRRILLLGILLAMVLLFGCIGGNDKSTTNAGDGKLNANTGSDGQGAKQDGTGSSSGQDAGTGMFNPSASQKCTIKDRTTGDVSIYYLDGKGNMRAEIKVANQEIVTIVKGESVYTQATAEMKQGPMLQDCDWLYFDAKDKSSGGIEKPPTAQEIKEMANTIARYEVSCVPQQVDESVLATPGKVCDLKKMMDEATKNPCASIPDLNQRAECEKAMAGYN